MNPLLDASDYIRMTPADSALHQLIEGHLVHDEAPWVSHHDAATNLFALLKSHAAGTGSGKAFIAPVDVYLDEHNVFQPDVFFVATRHRALERPDGIHGAPDFVAEVLSPGTAQRDREVKRRIYAACGTREFWLIDPQSRTIEVFDFYRGADTRPTRYVAADLIVSVVLPGFLLSCSEVFATDR